MADKERELAWNLITELRKETLESQRMRTQVIGFKITFLSAAIGFIYANKDKIPPESFDILLIIPAFAAIFFDYLIISYSISIRRIGLYCKRHLERQLKDETSMHKGFCFWEDFFETKQMRPSLAIFANLGITLLALAPTVGVLLRAYHPLITFALIVLLMYDVAAFLVPGNITREKENILTWFFFGRKSNRGAPFVLCTSNNGDDLEKGKLYQILPDADAAKSNNVRVIDDSGEGRLYPADCFIKVKLPPPVEKKLSGISS